MAPRTAVFLLIIVTKSDCQVQGNDNHVLSVPRRNNVQSRQLMMSLRRFTKRVDNNTCCLPLHQLLQVRGGSLPVRQNRYTDGRSLLRRMFKLFSLRFPLKRRGQQQQQQQESPINHTSSHLEPYNPLLFYLRCMGIVLIWISSGTLFYSYYNEWPLPQSFFYAVDAGMSIGFCTQVYETKLLSKAFTIGYILLGASVIGGALALFIQDMVEGLAKSPLSVPEYQGLLERDVFDQADSNRKGVLTFAEFEGLIHSSFGGSSRIGSRNANINNRVNQNTDIVISTDDVQRLWAKFDRLKDGVIDFEEFSGSYRGLERIIQSLQEQQASKNNPLRSFLSKISQKIQQAWQLENRIYLVFVLWMSMGISWGMIDQGWDIITATHFAVSALATGGLTAPDVNADGILPARPAIFCGVYCLLGIPLFALTLGHFAYVLVAKQVAALEREALTRPMTKQEYDLASHLTTNDDVVHLSDFIVLQLLRQGKLTPEAVQVLKEKFEMLDSQGCGTLSLGQATTIHPVTSGKER